EAPPSIQWPGPQPEPSPSQPLRRCSEAPVRIPRGVVGVLDIAAVVDVLRELVPDPVQGVGRGSELLTGLIPLDAEPFHRGLRDGRENLRQLTGGLTLIVIWC